MSNLIQSFQYGKQVVPYQIQFRRGRSLIVKVGLDQTVSVKAPQRFSLHKITEFIEKRAEWIVEKRSEFALLKRPGAERYEIGAWISFLGGKYRIEAHAADINLATLYAKTMQVKVAGELNQAKIAAVVDKWYREQALGLFTERLKICQQTARRAKIPAAKTLKIRRMRSRWGSCRRSGDITLNAQLIKLPLPLIDYVIMHELCHLKEFNHSKAFYALLDKTLPDWAKRREQLFQYVL